MKQKKTEEEERRKEGRGGGGLKNVDDCPIYLLPSWKRANSSAVLSSTVRAVTVTGPLALLGKQPCSLTSCQSEWILQMSTESKYLWEEMDERIEPSLVYIWQQQKSLYVSRCA